MSPFDILRFVLALAFVLGLIALLAWFARRAGWLGTFGPARGLRRLHILEAVVIDQRHKLVLVRRDGTEHLLILSQGAPIVVESGTSASARADAVPVDEDRS